jgi:hypothetical protein
MRKLDTMELPFDNDLLSSPGVNHLVSYNTPYTPAPVSDLKRGTVATAIPQSAATVLSVDAGNNGIDASLGLNQSTSLTGGVDSPPTPADSNIPGLDGTIAVSGGITVNRKMLMIILIIAVLVGLVWYFNPGNVLAR